MRHLHLLIIMKHLLLITLLLGSILVKAQGIYGFTNSGMETWTSNTSISNWTLVGGSISKVQHIKNGASGAAIKNEAGSAGKLVAAFPFTAKVPRAFFDYMFTLGSTSAADTCLIDIMLTRWNTGTNSREIIARVVRSGVYTDFSWQTFSYPFTYFNTLVSPDSCFIAISTSINAGFNVGTTLSVDNFAFEAPNGISASNAKNTSTSVYPNPVKTNATIIFELRKDSKVSLQISDVTGKVIDTYNFERNAGIQHEQLNVENLKSGIYFYEIKSADDLKTGKFSVSK